VISPRWLILAGIVGGGTAGYLWSTKRSGRAIAAAVLFAISLAVALRGVYLAYVLPLDEKLAAIEARFP
jgi:hypothetical protein